MRGKPQARPDFLTVINRNQCVPADHPLRAIKHWLEAVLHRPSPLFDELDAGVGRARIPSEPRMEMGNLGAANRCITG